MVNPISETTASALEEAAMDLVSTTNRYADSTEEEQPIIDSPTTHHSNGTSVTEAAIGNTPSASPTQSKPTSRPAEDINPMAENVTTKQTVSTTEKVTSGSQVAPDYGNYDDYQLLPDAPWPPPVFVKQNISPQERYYIEHRWYSQWSFFDSKASENKGRYYRTQLIVGLGSVTVPVLVGINAVNEPTRSVLYVVTVVISLAVAMSTAIESLYTFGDNWRSYRAAAEEMRQEKSLYDVKAGRYSDNPQGFTRFVERCEEIIAQQNGRWIQSQETAAEQAKEQGEEFLEARGGQPIDGAESTIEQTRTTTVEESFTATPTPLIEDETAVSDMETYVDPNAVDPATPTSYG